MNQRRVARALTAAVVALTVGAGTVSGASLFDPALRFRALPTEHFVIYFHQGEDRLAQRLARIAEDTWHALPRPLGVTPPPHTRVVLADQTDRFNGYATPIPYDTIVLYTVSPSGSGFDFDDWLRIGFTHEFTHILHLDRSESWAKVVRSMFGRTPYAFPNLFLPPWQVEGLATYAESAITGEGRLHAGDFLAIVEEAARHNRLEPIDRVNGGLTDWPAGSAAYAYGVGFTQYLADRFGVATLGALADATARRLPYVASPAFKRVYGESLGDLWREYEDSVTAAVGRSAPTDPAIVRLTHQGFSVAGPRFDRFPCPGCPTEIVYSADNPRGFPALYRVPLAGGDPRQVTTRYLGSTTGIGREVIYFDQIELRRNTGLYSDLYVFGRTDGRVRQLTSDARLQDPDLSPDGETLVCTHNRPGRRDLVLVRLKPDTTDRASAIASLKTRATSSSARPGSTAPVAQGFSPAIIPLISEPDTQFDTPRWSPDGRTIAVERHRLGEMPAIVTVDVATGIVHVVAAAARTRFTMPTWRPDGTAIVAAAAPDEQTFNLVEFSLDGSRARQLTRTTGGATWPDIAPDGRTIVFVGYTPEGSDVFSMPYPNDADAVGPSLGPANLVQASTPAADEEQKPRADPTGLPTIDYSPLDTLKPTWWTPIVDTGSGQWRAGAGVTGFDVLGYHGYAASATWLVSGPAGASDPGTAQPDWRLTYVYDRWRPTFYVSASSETSFFAGPPTAFDTPTSAARRERQLEAGVIVPIRHVRAQHTARLFVVRATDDYTRSDAAFMRDRTPLGLSWQTVTAHTYGYSISPENGVAAGATTEIVRQGFGSSANATITTGDVRVYLSGLAPHHVAALRLGGGASVGDPTVGRTFLLGGDSPGTGVTDLDSDAFSLLRGFPSNTFAGSRVALANAEYRFPLAWPQRGVGTWPFFLHAVHAAVFADVGSAWTRGFQPSGIKSSAGAQISADVVAGFFAPFTASIGAARGHDGSGLVADRVTAYLPHRQSVLDML